MCRTLLPLLTLCLCAAQAVIGQDSAPPPSPPKAPTLHANAALVFLPVLVKSSSNSLVPGLKPSDFHVFDNGIEQKSTLDTTEPQRMTLLVVMQTGGAAPREFSYYRGLPTMLDHLGGAAWHKAAVLTFDSQPEDLWSFTTDFSSLDDAFLKPDPGDHGAALLDAVDYGIGLLEKEPEGTRRVMLLLSQLHDEGSHVTSEAVVKRLGENNITILTVSFSPEKAWLKDQFTGPREGNKPYEMSPDHPPVLYTFNLSAPLMEAAKAMRNDTAATLAALSGGEQVRFDNRFNLDEDLIQLANDLPNRYLLSFQPTAPAKGYHTLSVKVGDGSAALLVTARAGYWAGERKTDRNP